MVHHVTHHAAQVRHALYYNASHTVRHLSFGTYFPGQRNPLDGQSQIYSNGTAQARYLIQARLLASSR